MKKVVISIFMLTMAILLVLYLKQDFEKAPPTLYYNGNIITINDRQPHAEAMLVQNGLISSIGSLNDMDFVNIPDLVEKDLEGATVLPGFIDVHTHFALSMFLSAMYDLSGFRHDTNEEVWQYFEKVSREVESDEYLMFKGLDPILVKDLETPSIEYLDSVYPDNPIVVFSQSLHNYWANTIAFEKVGINASTSDPSSHSYYEKDDAGNLTGHIVEQEAFRPFMESLKEEVLTAKLLGEEAMKVMQGYSDNGNTSIVSTGLTISDAKPLLLLQHLSDKEPSLLGGLLSKLGILPKRQPMPRHFIYMRHDMSDLLPEKRGEPNDFYDIIGVKHWYDGSPYIGSMYMDSAYLDTELTSQKLNISIDTKGKALIGPQGLEDFIREHHNSGWQIAIHTQGDAAITEVVNAYERLDAELDYSESRHRLEHCLMLPSSELSKMHRLHLTPSFHINHLYYYGAALKDKILGEQRTHTLLPLKSTTDEGIPITLHADQPMFESLPFRLMQTAIERKTKEGEVIGKEERVSVMEALKAVTINAAWQIHMEDKLGSLEPGKYADFIIVNDNPLKIPIDQLSNIECINTYINGNEVKS